MIQNEGLERKIEVSNRVECRRLLWSSRASGCDSTTCRYVTLTDHYTRAED